MTITLGSTNGYTGSGSDTSVTITKPSGLSDDDVLLFFLYVEAGGAITWPSGFSEEASYTASGYTIKIAAKAVAVAASEPANYTASWSGADWAAGLLGAASGVDTTTPVQTTARSSGSSSTITMPSVTTVDDDQVIVCLASDYDWYPKTTPSGTTLWATTPTYEEIELYYFTQASAGATPAKTSSLGSSHPWQGIQIALNLASAAQTITPAHIASASAVYAPAVSPGAVGIAPDHITSTSAVYEPTLTRENTITPDHITSASAVYEPTVSPGAAGITPDHMASTSQVYEPMLAHDAQIITPDTIASTAAVYEPTVTLVIQTIIPDHIASALAVYQPTIIGGVTTTAKRTGWELHLRHYGRDGTAKNGYIAPLVCRYTNSLEADEPLVFSIDTAGYALMVDIAEYDIVEVMVRNLFLGVASASGGFVRDFVGIVRGSQPDRETNDDGITYLTWYAPEHKHALSWRRIMWPSGVSGKSTFATTPAETVVKDLIADNCTSVATVANGRWREGDLAAGMDVSLDIEADGAAGADVSLSFTGAEMLKLLAKVCELGGDYYLIEWQGGSVGGAHEFAVTWGRGSDKSTGANRVLFSPENNTMRNPRRRYVPSSGTTAVAAGQNKGTARLTSTVNGGDYASGNDIELFVDARNEDTADGREGRAAAVLLDTQELSELEFDVLQTSDIFYSPVSVTGRKTYTVGDLVLVSYGTDEIRRIRRTAVSWVLGDTQFNITVEAEYWAAA